MKGGHIDDIVEGATGSLQRCFKIFESELNLLSKVWFRCSVVATSNLAGDENQIA